MVQPAAEAGAGRRSSGPPSSQTSTSAAPATRRTPGLDLDPGALARHRRRLGIVLVVLRGGDDVVVVAVVDRGDELGALGVSERSAVAVLADVADGVAGVEPPEAVLEQRPGCPG